MTNDEIRNLQKRARGLAIKWGHKNLADDFAQEAVIYALAHGQIRLEWVLIDFLRREYGSSRPASGRLRQLAERFGMSLDEPLGDEPGADTRHTIIASAQPEPRPLGSGWRDRVVLTGREAVIAELVYDHEVSGADIATLLGVTESRISQLLKPVKKEIAKGAVFAEAMDLYRDDPEYSKLVIRWIAV